MSKLKYCNYIQENNQINGKQYPFGYKKWLRGVAWELKDYKDINYFDYEKLDADSWLVYFNDGLSPRLAVYMDQVEGGQADEQV